MASVYLDQVRKDFDAAQGTYDDYAALQHREYLALYDFALNLQDTGFPRVHRALDIGSGAGAGLLGLNHSMGDVRPKEFYAIDLSERMLGSQQFPSCAANMNALPFLDSSFDLVISNFALHWSEHPEQALGEMFRVLSKDGVGLLSVPVSGSFDLFTQVWASVGLPSPVHLFPCSAELLLHCSALGNVDSQIVRRPVVFHEPHECIDWLRKTGVRQKNRVSNAKTRMSRVQYRGILDSLNTAFATGEHLSFELLHVVFSNFSCAKK